MQLTKPLFMLNNCNSAEASLLSEERFEAHNTDLEQFVFIQWEDNTSVYMQMFLTTITG